MLEKLYVLGLIPTKWDLEAASKVSASAFCRRRLPVVMVRNKMSENIKNASKLVEHGHVRVGAEVVKDPAFLITRTMEDFVTWVDSSKIRQHVLEYNDMKDDYDFDWFVTFKNYHLINICINLLTQKVSSDNVKAVHIRYQSDESLVGIFWEHWVDFLTVFIIRKSDLRVETQCPSVPIKENIRAI